MKALTISVSVLVTRGCGEARQVLLLRRRPERGGFWQSVSGKIEEGETAPQTAVREVREETGLEVMRLFIIDFVNTYYEPRRDAVILEPFFAAEVGEGEVKRSPEHTEHAWRALPDARAALELPTHLQAIDAFLSRIASDPSYLTQPISLE